MDKHTFLNTAYFQITLNNLDVLRDSLIDKTINKATISLTIETERFNFFDCL